MRLSRKELNTSGLLAANQGSISSQKNFSSVRALHSRSVDGSNMPASESCERRREEEGVSSVGVEKWAVWER